jgi:hypothetical protein
VRLDDGGIGASDGDGDGRIRNSARGEGGGGMVSIQNARGKRRRIVYIPILICKARRMSLTCGWFTSYLQEGYKLNPTQPLQNTVCPSNFQT